MTTTVLVAYDESPQSEAALGHALSKFPEAEITVIHVNDPREWVFADDDDLGGYYSEQSYREVTESAAAVLEEAESIAAGMDREVDTVTVSGRPADEILEYADEHDVDHVVLGSHGRRGLERFLLGSVAERVAKRSPTSVTIIRQQDPE